MNDNPYETLRLDPGVTEADIIRQAALLRQQASSEEEVAAIREAVHRLTASEQEKQLHALLTHAGAIYGTRTVQMPSADHAASPEEVAEALWPILAKAIRDVTARSEPKSSTLSKEELSRTALSSLRERLPIQLGA